MSFASTGITHCAICGGALRFGEFYICNNCKKENKEEKEKEEKMNKKIKVIELLNKIANGEEVPKRIKSEDKEFYFQENETSVDYLYRTDRNGNGWLVVQDIALNEEVEILEDNTEEIKELTRYENMEDYDYRDMDINRDKINELVRAINELRKEKE